MKHSPAPWSVHPYRDGKLHEVKSDSGNFKSASISIGSGEVLIGEFNHFDNAAGYPSPTFEEMHANARLAIAAPELLEAVEMCVQWIKDLAESGDAGFWNAEEQAVVIRSRMAIAKAKEVA